MTAALRRNAIGLAVSALVHGALLAILVAWWPSRPVRTADVREPARAATSAAPGAPGRPQQPASPTRIDDAQAEPREHAATPRTAWRSAMAASAAAARVGGSAPGRRVSLMPMALSRGSETALRSVFDHVWESTLFAGVVALLTLAFRKNDARVRYWLWFAATVKFLVPFALLEGLGSRIPGVSAVHAAASYSAYLATSGLDQPLARVTFPAASALAGNSALADWMRVAAFVVWALGLEFVVMMRFRAWRAVRAAVRASAPIALASEGLPASVRVRSSPTVLEPGVVGFRRPTLLLPAGIQDHLGAPELDAVLAHEACHIRCRDNLTAAVQMVAEAVLWFHPMVWWIGARMISERERACDEHVLRAFDNPRAYADGIVTVCKRYVDARLACVPGVSSSDLRRRIERIMKKETGEPVARWKAVVLAGATVMAVAVPVGIGAVTAPPRMPPQAPAPRSSTPTGSGDPAFDVASVKENVSGAFAAQLDVSAPGRFTATNVPPGLLIRFAYDLPDFEVSGGPGWFGTDRFDIVASTGPATSVDEKRRMLRRLLVDRFGLATHNETRDVPIYALTMARGDHRLGPRLRQSSSECSGTTLGSVLFPGRIAAPDMSNGAPTCGFFGMSPESNLPAGIGGMAFRGLTMASLAKTLVNVVRRDVTDDTGLTGYFDGDIDFLAELPPPPPPPGVPSLFGTFESVFTVLPEQLGLKLDSRRGPVAVLVIDGAQHPASD